MVERTLKEKGEVDYDYKHDILFFKTLNRTYSKSIELNNVVLDIDDQDFVVAIQIMEAAKFLNIDKKTLLKIRQWKFEVIVSEGIIQLKLFFEITRRNKIIEKNPIIMQPTQGAMKNSELICTAVCPA